MLLLFKQFLSAKVQNMRLSHVHFAYRLFLSKMLKNARPLPGNSIRAANLQLGVQSQITLQHEVVTHAPEQHLNTANSSIKYQYTKSMTIPNISITFWPHCYNRVRTTPRK